MTPRRIREEDGGEANQTIPNQAYRRPWMNEADNILETGGGRVEL